MEQPASSTVQLRSRGVLTLPKALRDKYDLDEGDALHLVDVDGTFVLTPMQPVVPTLAREIERLREEKGLSTDQLLKRLRDEREALTNERYGEPPDTKASEDDRSNDARDAANESESGDP
jgi:bifunctional DNA-binding transcriptional regulator/antitoxin component of YhaV-PrlF toxin-antitoxin module